MLEADHGRAVLLDYRGLPDGDPAVLVVGDLNASLIDAFRFAHFDDLLARLCFQRSGWDEVAKPHETDVSEAETRASPCDTPPVMSRVICGAAAPDHCWEHHLSQETQS